jgi:hypothetical protein
MGRGKFAQLFVATLLMACGSKASPTDDSARPVDTCLEYETAIDTCLHRDAAIAHQPSLLAKTDAERGRIRAVCAENLRRLKTACR